jgi:hypothetical protein
MEKKDQRKDQVIEFITRTHTHTHPVKYLRAIDVLQLPSNSCPAALSTELFLPLVLGTLSPLLAKGCS